MSEGHESAPGEPRAVEGRTAGAGRHGARREGGRRAPGAGGDGAGHNGSRRGSARIRGRGSVAAPNEAEASAGPDSEGEPVDVEPVVEERPKSTTPHASHLPPPPPSIRVKAGVSARARLEVTGTPKLAQDLMTKKLFTIGPGDVIAHVEEHMQAFRFRHLPVVDDRKLVGLISHEDLLRASPSLFSAKAKQQDELIHQLPAKHIMQKELHTVRPTATLEEVAVLMWEAKLGCVLVTEEDKTLSASSPKETSSDSRTISREPFPRRAAGFAGLTRGGRARPCAGALPDLAVS